MAEKNRSEITHKQEAAPAHSGPNKETKELMDYWFDILKKKIVGQPKKEMHYGHAVWINPKTEPLRRTECLCLNCADMKPGQKGNCRIAQSFFKICAKENIALMVTRCPNWSDKK